MASGHADSLPKTVNGATASRHRRKLVAVHRNDAWKERLRWFETFLDTQTMLAVRQTSRLFYSHKYKVANGCLAFDCFRGCDTKILCERLLPMVFSCIHESDREEGLKLDFSRCTLLKDASVARIMQLIHGKMKDNGICGKVKSLYFNCCYQITDLGLAAMLTTYLPYLEELSVRCARSKELTGLPFTQELSKGNWPNFIKFDCSFSNIWLEPITSVARCITSNAKHMSKTPEIKIYGSWGSTCLFTKLSIGCILKSFSLAVKTLDHNLVSKLSKKAQQEFANAGEASKWHGDVLVQLLKNSGSKMLVNAPLTVETSEEDGGVEVWTLPISVAIQQENQEMFYLLLKRGAEVDVWDYLGKSPLFRACEASCDHFAEALIQLGVSVIPHDLSGQSALDIGIKKKDVHKVELILRNGGILNYKCPAIRKYKSALYVACETNSPELIRLLLKWGADPNWNTPARLTPVMVAYQLSPTWLPFFLECGAGLPESKRWVLAAVLSCAIAKSDIDSIRLLIDKFPDLLTRPHHIWSLPHIQAAKLGKTDILAYFLEHGSDANGMGGDGATGLHVATAEGYTDTVRLLLKSNADVDKGMLNGKTALHIACLENSTELVELLIDANCNPNICDNVYHETALMSCIRTRNVEAALCLIQNAQNLDCDTVNNNGRTSLMYAMFFGQYEVADELISRGADVLVTDDFGISIFTIVYERMANPRSEKRVLKRFLRRYKALAAKPPPFNGLSSHVVHEASDTAPAKNNFAFAKNGLAHASKPLDLGKSTAGNTRFSIETCKSAIPCGSQSVIASENPSTAVPSELNSCSESVNVSSHQCLNTFGTKDAAGVKKPEKKFAMCKMRFPMGLLKVTLAK